MNVSVPHQMAGTLGVSMRGCNQNKGVDLCGLVAAHAAISFAASASRTLCRPSFAFVQSHIPSATSLSSHSLNLSASVCISLNFCCITFSITFSPLDFLRLTCISVVTVIVHGVLIPLDTHTEDINYRTC